MSIFITPLAFDNSDIIEDSKITLMLSSLVAGFIGFVILKHSMLKPTLDEEVQEIRDA